MGSIEITELLNAWRAGDAVARERVSSLVYARLKALAVQRFARESSGHTLQPTALLHEALLRLWGSEVTPRDRQHLFALASMHMRSILLDHARARLAQKRGGDAVKVLVGSLDEVAAERSGHSGAQAAIDFLALEQAIVQLELDDPRTAQMLCLHYFGGLEQGEIAEQLALSLTTVERGLRFARAWLKQTLN
jgi:RNA polymerase sigma factor (TIGR02999 family)